VSGGIPGLWDEGLPYFVNNAYAHLDAQPESLLETDGGPVGIPADVYMGRMIGPDDQIIADVRLPSAVPEWLTPIAPPLRVFGGAEVDPLPYVPMGAARYVLQSGYATLTLGGEYAPKDVEPGPPWCQFTVLFLRYRRRL
jgi:hypothetical protein